jgi:hypothetical protein
MARIRPMGKCEECPAVEGLKEIVSHGLCAKHNQQRLRAIWRKPEPSETQKQKLMEKLEKDLIAIKNMCSKWERDGYVAMKLMTPETIETFRTELGDYLDFRPTLKAAPPQTELEEALAGNKAPSPMFADEDVETAVKKSVPGQYQFAPVVENPAAPAATAATGPPETPGNLVENLRPTPLSGKKKAATGQRSGTQTEDHQEGTELKAGGQRMSH